ncbi:MAG: hypothetical protein DRG78_01825 [Epsilonproteobacteria bacterium]|nr:MAG: hypothetical protein DRG78_01825 [Campylobacterota bacterium]
MIENLEYIIIGTLIVIVWIVSFIQSRSVNNQKLKEYKENSDKLIFDEYNEPIKSANTPGILMSIGIIGTFLLIYTGLSSIPSSLDIAKVLEVIKNQIAPAFLVSAFGIVMSIIYTMVERWLILNTYTKKINLLKSNNKSIKTYETISTEQLEISSKLLIATEEQTKTFESLSSFSDGLEGMTKSMSKFEEISDKLANSLDSDKLGKVIAKAINDEISPILNSIKSINENVDKNSEKLTRFLEEDLKNEIMIPLKNSVDNTSESMKYIEKALIQTSEAMDKTNKGFDNLNNSLDKLEYLQENFVLKLDGVLDKQKTKFEKTTETISNTYTLLTDTVSGQIDKFNENSKDITDSFTGLSSEMKDFLISYKKDYKELLTNQEQAIKETSEKAVEILDKSGQVASKTIIDASDKLQSTLDGVDVALVKTSETITEKLTEFKDAYTDTLKQFLDSQADELHKVFGEHTEKLKDVVIGFKDTLENDVDNRKILNEDLEKLVKTTNGFVSDTKAMIATGWDTQHQQLKDFMETNKLMESKLTHIVDNATNINDNGNILTKELIDTTGNLAKQFNDNQKEILKEYQINVEKHLSDILGAMLSIIEVSHSTKD